MNPHIQQEITVDSIEEFIKTAHHACMRLNSCLPEGQRIEIQCTINALAQGLDSLAKKIATSIQAYERSLQHLEQTLRKHIKNQIELKLYYEHLEEIIANLRKEKQKDQICIDSLKTELKDKQKYLMTITNHNTKSGDDAMIGLQSKLDTITKIKNRLSLNDTGEFYGRNYGRRNERDHDTKDLHNKRETLATALQKLCEKPQQKSTSRKKQSKNNSRSKSKSKSKSKSNKQLQNSKSHLIIKPNSTTPSQSPASKFNKTKPPNKEKSKTKDYANEIRSGLSSRRNSKC